MYRIWMVDIRSDHWIKYKVTDAIEEKVLKCSGHGHIKTMPSLLTIHTRATLPTEDPNDDHQGDKMI